MVKYADGPTTHVEVDIDAPASDVWPLVSDINVPARFSQEFQGAEWVDDGPAEGARFRGHNRHPRIGEWTADCTVSAFEHRRVFEWSVAGPDARAARWRFDLDDAGDAGCTLRFSAELGPGRSGLSQAIEAMPDREEQIVARRLEEWTTNMTATVEGIKELAEGAGGASA